MPIRLGIILIFFPLLLFGQNFEGDLYFHGSLQQDTDELTEIKGIFGGNLKLFNDAFYADISSQLAVPFDGSDIEGNFSTLGEMFFPWGGVSAHTYYQGTADSLNDQIRITGEIYRTVEKPSYIFEYGDIFDYTYYPEYRNFDHVDNAIYLLYKKFYRIFALHTYFDFTYRYFNNISEPAIGLTRASAELYFSRSLKRNIGLKYGVYVNKNITTTDSLIYVSSELFDPFAYDLYRIFAGSTIYLDDLLLKPEMSMQQKAYNTSAAETSYSETGLMLSIYADYPLNNNLFIYSNNFVLVSLDSPSGGSSFKASLGIRYSFAK